MRVTTGIDIIEVERIDKELLEHGDQFKERLFTNIEQEYCAKAKAHCTESFAARFCAKEAVFKALDLDKNADINWTDIEVENKETGRPEIKLHGALKAKMEEIENIDISLSHVNEMAIASVVILWK